MGASGSKMTLDEFLKGDQKDPIADVASGLAGLMTKAAISAKDAGVKAAGEAAKEGAKAAMGAAATAAAGTAAGAVAGAVAGPIGMVVGALATAILNGVWDAIFPSTPVRPAIEEIREALGQELRDDTIIKINGLLEDLKNKLTIDYADRRRNRDLTDIQERRRLHDMLMGQNDKLDGVIGTLMQDKYAKIGLVNFLLLAGLRLALYQEMANVDPNNEDPRFNPAKSTYATPQTGIVAEYARKYAIHTEKYWGLVLQDRRKKIKVTDWGEDGARIDDELTGGFQQDTNRSADALAEEYWGWQKKKLEEKFCNPEKIIANWRCLVEVPINIPHIPDEPPRSPEGWAGWFLAPVKKVWGWIPGVHRN